MLIIDKKRMRITESGLPQMVIDQTPKLMRRSKVPIIKAKVGPQILSLICDEKIFESVPVKKEVKATVSGIYVLEVKGLHGKTEMKEEKKKGFWKRAVEAAQEKAGANFVICPKSPLPLGHICHDPLVMREAYDLGRSEANEHMKALERFLGLDGQIGR